MRDLIPIVHEWTKGRFVADAGYYAGRPPSKSDLNSDLLEMIYTGIKGEKGDEAAANFVQVVNNLDDLAASSFIVAFERFWSSGCTLRRIEQHADDRNTVTGYGAARDAQAFAVIFGALGGRRRSPEEDRLMSQEIKQPFVTRHFREIDDE